ncbi:hypothetical protein LTR84_002469 [Exophiala bonariae]|uniref:Transcription factor domain-containing protein n=1 Tax=Exophiala bonariae TaxID=1690606 RepID=A0AAV9NDK9_9EURO|nr:hypothetical protein LTR84_002469 [Exophiala bonariae]
MADVLYSSTYLTTPLFNLDKWGFEASYECWRQESGFDKFWEETKKRSRLDRAINDCALRAIFDHLRELLAAEQYVRDNPQPPTSDSFRWMNARREECESRLLSGYTELDGAASGNHLRGSESIMLAACTCLAAICWIEVTFGFALPKKRDLLLSRLTTCISNCGAVLSGKLKLWILFVGLLLEGSVRNSPSGNAYMMQAKEVQQEYCTTAEAVLEGFLYSKDQGAYGHN